MTAALNTLTLAEIGRQLASGETTSQQITKQYLERIEAVEPQIGAFVTVLAEDAMAQASAADRARAEGQTGPLLGVPLGIKDLICTEGQLTTCASKMLSNFVPPYDATVARKLKDAGAVFLGKLNMDEFAMGSSCENSSVKPCANPWDTERIPGGSSGGSAAAVAAGQCPASLGSDTGGSIRQPASHCGVVGLKPTYGRVSRYGLVAFASSLDQIGPMTRTVEDSAILLNAIAGHDPLDSTSAPVETPDFTQALGRDIKGLRIGLPKEYFIEGIDLEVEQTVMKAIEQMRGLGAEIVDVSLPHTEYAVATYYVCATAEASSNLARYDGAHYGWRAPDTDNIIDMFTQTRTQGFGEEVKRRIMLGTFVLSAGFYDAYYSKAMKVRTLLKRDFEDAFKRCDVVVTPVSPTAAFKRGEKTGDPLQMYLSDIFTISLNLAGLPGMSVPCGFTGEGLPVGVQMIAPAFSEARLFQLGHAYEQTQQWWNQMPELG